MNELLDRELMRMLEGITQNVSELFGSFIGIATILAGMFALIYLGIESYKMMLGEKQIEVSTLLRPFMIGFVIMLWVPFINLIDVPCDALTDAAREMFENRLGEIDDAHRNRASIQDSITMRIVENSVNASQANEVSTDEEIHRMGIRLDGLIKAVAGLQTYIVGKIRQIAFNILESIIIMLWKAAVYLILFLRLMFKSVLAIVGPISFAFSLLPSWRDAWSSWVSRYITVNLYGFLAYIELALSTAIIQYNIEDDIDVLQAVNADEDAFALFTIFQSGYHNGLLPALVVSAIGLLLVPKVAEWIIPSSGTSGAASSAKRNAIGGAQVILKAI